MAINFRHFVSYALHDSKGCCSKGRLDSGLPKAVHRAVSSGVTLRRTSMDGSCICPCFGDNFEIRAVLIDKETQSTSMGRAFGHCCGATLMRGEAVSRRTILSFAEPIVVYVRGLSGNSERSGLRSIWKG